MLPHSGIAGLQGWGVLHVEGEVKKNLQTTKIRIVQHCRFTASSRHRWRGGNVGAGRKKTPPGAREIGGGVRPRAGSHWRGGGAGGCATGTARRGTANAADPGPGPGPGPGPDPEQGGRGRIVRHIRGGGVVVQKLARLFSQPGAVLREVQSSGGTPLPAICMLPLKQRKLMRQRDN